MMYDKTPKQVKILVRLRDIMHFSEDIFLPWRYKKWIEQNSDHTESETQESRLAHCIDITWGREERFQDDQNRPWRRDTLMENIPSSAAHDAYQYRWVAPPGAF